MAQRNVFGSRFEIIHAGEDPNQFRLQGGRGGNFVRKQQFREKDDRPTRTVTQKRGKGEGGLTKVEIPIGPGPRDRDLSVPDEVKDAARRAGKALGDPSIEKELTRTQAPIGQKGAGSAPVIRFRGETIGSGPGDKVLMGGERFGPGDIGTAILFREVQRREGLEGKKAAARAHSLAKKEELKGFKRSGSFVGDLITSKTFGIPNLVLLAGTMAASSALGGAAGPTTSTGAGSQKFLGVEAGTGKAAFGGVSKLQFGPGIAPATLTRGGLESAKASGALKAGSASSLLDTGKRILRAAKVANSLLGGGGRQQPQPQQQQLQLPRLPGIAIPVFSMPAFPQFQPQRSFAGAQPASFRRNRDKFGGTSTASLFQPREEQFGARTRRSTRLGG